jgi:hypothetical protein
MKNRIYIAVTKHTKDFTDKVNMTQFQNEEQLLSHIADLHSHSRKLVRSFSVNEIGNVDFYEVVFNGSLEMKPIPREEKASRK